MTVLTMAFDVTGKRVVVVGAARSGLAAARLLADRGAHVTLTDTRSDIAAADALAERGVVLELGAHRADTLASADLVVLSPGVPSRQPALDAARAKLVPIVGELELASRWLEGRIVAVTGTKGKSTTTTLIGRMLNEGGVNAVVGGNIGVPLSDQVATSKPETVHVVETSSFQLESTDTFHPWIAVLLNFFPDHLDRHADEAEYAAAKARIFANQGAGDWAVVNADDPETLRLASGGRARRFVFSLGPVSGDGVGLVNEMFVAREGQRVRPLFPSRAVRLTGRHLLSDVAAAAAAATLCGVDAEAMTRAVEGFDGLEHALEPAGEVGSVRFVNDSKATNVDAARRAVEGVEGPLVVILGGRFKGGSLDRLRDTLASHAVAAVLIGESRPLFREAFSGAVPIHEADDMRGAVRTAWSLAPAGGAVLLAPACASFDMFDDYAHRGRAFKQEVAALAAGTGEM
jgi:UDP-N-acetylmuramoylalanine--D-glutamate ligase